MNNKEKFEQYRERFRDLYDAIKRMRASTGLWHPCHRGHDMTHDITVAQFVIMISPDERTAEKAFCAALLHSMDYLIARDESVGERIRMTFSSHGPHSYFSLVEYEEIIEAAIRHKELNRDDQSLTQQVLMDADRLAGMMLTTVISLAKCAPELPAFEFEYLGEMSPATTYKKPASTLDNTRTHFWYMPMFRLPKAKEIATDLQAQLRAQCDAIKAQYEQIGLAGIKI